MKQVVGILLCWLALNASGQQLKHYTCVVDRLNVRAYEDPNNTQYSKDKQGIIMDRGRYHPVRIAMYGILCHAEFLATGDSSYYHKMVAQMPFFKDSTKWDIAFDGKGIGFPYHYEFHDLKPPWYSGMAQGAALSYLLRYSALTGDQSVYPFCRRIAYFMLQPAKAGGTISTLDDGELWIEEYPNSREAPQVLNGSINGLIGLMEYCTFFPNDTTAERIKNNCLVTMEQSLPYYNLADWCKYDRQLRNCTPDYLRYHVYQMKHLYELTGKAIYYRQMMLWATFCSERPSEDSSGLVQQPRHLISVHSKPGPNPWLLPKHDMVPELSRPGRKGAAHVFSSKKDLENYLKGGTPPAQDDSTSETQFLLLEFNEPVPVNYLTFELSAQQERLGFELYGVSRARKIVPLQIKEDLLGGNYWHCFVQQPLPTEGLQQLVIKSSGVSREKLKRGKVGIYHTQSSIPSWFGHYRTQPVPVKKDKKYQVDVPQREVKEMTILYRTAPNKMQTQQQAWNPNDVMEGNTFTAEMDGYYQFLIIHKMENPLSITGMLSYREIEE